VCPPRTAVTRVVGLRQKDEFASVFVRSVMGWYLSRCMPVRPGYYGNDAALLRYRHYGSQEATTAGHHRMVVRGVFDLGRLSLLIFVVALK
jgi:hypothetical protein